MCRPPRSSRGSACRPFETLVTALSKDYGVHPYSKWGGAFWRLISLRDLGMTPGHEGAEDGTWRVEGKWWKGPGSKGSNVEVVDWGAAANEVGTERAESVLRAAGRQ